MNLVLLIIVGHVAITAIVAVIVYKKGFCDGTDDTIKRLKKVPVRKY